MTLVGDFGLKQLLKTFKKSISVTWLLVLLENALISLIPLLIGLAIDGLLSGNHTELLQLFLIMSLLIVIAVIRRVYDTRVYGTIRVKLGLELERRHEVLPVSSRNARLDMARELVDFIEEEVPELFTSTVQIIVALVILMTFDNRLALSALALIVSMAITYSFFHGRFFRLNAALNGQVENQVNVLSKKHAMSLMQHLNALRKHEVSLSDTEAILYGLIFFLAVGFMTFNLWLCSTLPEMTSGKIFTIVSYSWEYAESAIMLPIALQSWSRLHEITIRLNSFSRNANGEPLT